MMKPVQPPTFLAPPMEVRDREEKSSREVAPMKKKKKTRRKKGKKISRSAAFQTDFFALGAVRQGELIDKGVKAVKDFARASKEKYYSKNKSKE